jgi:hypothetical protein
LKWRTAAGGSVRFGWGARSVKGGRWFTVQLRPINLGKFGSIPLKDHHFGYIPLLSHLHVSPHELMTCGVHGIYLKFGSFNGIDPIVPLTYNADICLDVALPICLYNLVR